MKVVSISLDPQLLNAHSVAATRIALYGSVVDRYTVIVPSASTAQVALSPNVTVEGSGGKNKLSQLFNSFLRTRTYIRDGFCDVLSTDQYFFGLMGVYCARRYGVAHEVVALGFEKFTPLRKRIAHFVMRNCHSIRVNSEWLRTFVFEQFKISGEKVHMAPIYVVMDTMGLKNLTAEKVAELEEARAVFKQHYSSYFNILAVNRLVPDKNIDMQLNAVASLKQEFPNIKLHIAGSGSEEDRLKKLCVTLGLEQEIVWHGHATGMKLGALYKECDVFVLTSNREGWGMVIAEALTAELPIIMTNVGAAGDLVKHEESALVVPIRDETAFTEALRRFIEDRALRERLREGGKTALKRLLPQDEILRRYAGSWNDAFAQAHRA